jgi:hypothetical protein
MRWHLASVRSVSCASPVLGVKRMAAAVSLKNFQTTKKTMKSSNLYLVMPGTGRITLQSSAGLLDQLRVRIDWSEASEPTTSKPPSAALEAIGEIAWASARQSVESSD